MWDNIKIDIAANKCKNIIVYTIKNFSVVSWSKVLLKGGTITHTANVTRKTTLDSLKEKLHE